MTQVTRYGNVLPTRDIDLAKEITLYYRTFTREQFKKASTEFLMNYGSEDDETQIRDNYSGRGMYGETCVGVVGSSVATAIQFMYALAEVLHDDEYDQKDFVLEMAEAIRTDNMAFNTIFYFPGYTVSDEG